MKPSVSSLEATRDQIQVLLQQEGQSYYRCADYMAHERPSVLDLECCNSILEECANVVHDRSSFDSEMSDESGKGVIKVQSSLSIRDVKDIQTTTPPSAATSQTFTHWRQLMFDWACMVVDGYGIEREAVALSFSLLDRFMVVELAKVPQAPPITRDDYQLFSMTSLFIAIKVIETFHKKLPVQVFVDMSKNYYTKEVIEATERDMLQALNWYVHAPTGLTYARLLMQLFDDPVSRHMQSTIVTLTELAVADSRFVACRPSTIGLAAVVHAAHLEGLSNDALTYFYTQLHEATGSQHVQDCAEFRMVYRQLEKLYYH